jgi:hypothetical protein
MRQKQNPYSPVGRLDAIIDGLLKLHADAEEIIDSHIRVLKAQTPDIPEKVLRCCEIDGKHGSGLNYIAILKSLRSSQR